jgi:hypothetical protein
VKSVAENTSIKNNKLCKTNPIFGKPKMNLTDYKINTYINNSRLSTMQKRSQTNPIYGEQAQRVEPFMVSTVEPPVVSLSNLSYSPPAESIYPPIHQSIHPPLLKNLTLFLIITYTNPTPPIQHNSSNLAHHSALFRE